MSKINLNNKKERGSILVFSVLLLASILVITLTLAAIFIPKIRAASDAGPGSVGAIYAADSGIEWCLYTHRGNPPLPSPSLSSAVTGATYTVSSDCSDPGALDAQVVGSYRGVSRSLELTSPAE